MHKLAEWRFGVEAKDDAGARRFALYADATVHPKESGLLDARLAQWQGPAVVAAALLTWLAFSGPALVFVDAFSSSLQDLSTMAHTIT